MKDIWGTARKAAKVEVYPVTEAPFDKPVMFLSISSIEPQGFYWTIAVRQLHPRYGSIIVENGNVDSAFTLDWFDGCAPLPVPKRGY